MDSNYWSLERWRLILVLFGGFLGGMLTGYWLVSFFIALAVYVVWLLFKLQQLYKWLEKGGKASSIPDSDGIWERINFHINKTQKRSDRRKERMGTLLKRFQGIITNLPYATVVLTTNNEIDWANKLSVKLLKIDVKKDRGQRVENLIRDPKVIKLLSKNKQKEIEISAPHNKQLKLALQLIPIEGDLKLLIARDISERVDLQQMRKNFIANASHELRTPLTVIAGYLEILQMNRGLPEQLLPAVKSATEQSMRMQSIIEDLLTLSRLENSELSDDKNETLPLAEIIHNICAEEAILDEDKHPIDLSQLDESLKLKGSQLEIVSVCSNLIHNAIRYTPENTIITIVWKRLESGAGLLSVEDNGQGIAPEHLAHLTERFYRVDKGRSQSSGGTGLGLAIVQHIIHRHGGRLDIQSTVGKGSQFSVYFPTDRVI
jgi:two-component system phosphate regulon sensor histidine kinase PhoR